MEKENNYFYCVKYYITYIWVCHPDKLSVEKVC